MDAILKWNAPASKRAEVVNEGFESGIPSAWKTIDADGDGNNWTTTPPPGGSSFTEFNPVQNLTAEQAPNSMDAILKWNAPASKRAEVLNEGFESGIPSAWKTIDADGDGNNWTTTPPPGGSSFSGHEGGSCVSTGNDAANFTNALLEETLTAKSVVTSPEAIRGTRAQGTWYQKTVQLPAGTKYVAFRHFNCTDFFWLNLDDVVITSGNAPLYTYTIYRNNTQIASDFFWLNLDDVVITSGNAPLYTYTIYRNNTQIASGVTETTYRDPDLAAGSYTYGVKVVYPNGESAMETTTLNITSLADVTVQKPYTLTVVGKTITVSCQGEAMIYDMNGRRLAAGRNTVVYTAQGGSYAVMVVVDGKSYVEKLAVAAGRNTVVYTAQGGSYAVMVVVDGKSYVEKLAVK
nr:choice-of-anchor J domain-containing protein [Porphyromonas sp. COT-052 OH4946]